MLQVVDALRQEGLHRAAEEEAERRARPSRVLCGCIRIVEARLEQLELEPAELPGVERERSPTAGAKLVAVRRSSAAMLAACSTPPRWRDRVSSGSVGPMALTRRSLLRAGAAAGAAAMVGVRPWAAMAAGGPGYLTRSAYAGLEGTSFTVETGAKPVVLRLVSVSDVAGAATSRSLAGSDDAFALTFSGPLATPLDSGIHTLHHPSLGSFELFSSPVDTPDGARTYEVVVDRSVGVAAARSEAPQATGAEAPGPEKTTASEPEPAARLVRRASLRHAGRWARCEVVLGSSVEAERVRCRLVRKGRFVARAGRELTDRRAVMRFEATHRLASGAYTLLVTAVDADGETSFERIRVTLR